MFERLRSLVKPEPKPLQALQLPTIELATGNDIKAAMRAANLRYPWINPELAKLLTRYQCFHDPKTATPYHTTLEIECYPIVNSEGELIGESIAARLSYGATPEEIDNLKRLFDNPLPRNSSRRSQIEADTQFPFSQIQQSWNLEQEAEGLIAELSLTTTKPLALPDHLVIQTQQKCALEKVNRTIDHNLRSIDTILGQLKQEQLLPMVPPLYPIPPYEEAG